MAQFFMHAVRKLPTGVVQEAILAIEADSEEEAQAIVEQIAQEPADSDDDEVSCWETVAPDDGDPADA